MRITETQFQHDYKVCRLKENVKIDAFCCGDEDLDDFILNESSFYTKALISVTYIVLDKRQDNKIVAYFSLANDKLSVNGFDLLTKKESRSDTLPLYFDLASF